MDELYGLRGVMASATWQPQAAGATFQWDGRSGRCHPLGGQMVTEPGQPCSFQCKGSLSSVPPVHSYWSTEEIGPAPGVHLQAVAWDREASRVTFVLDPALLAGTTPRMLPKATGALRWRPVQAQTTSCPLGAAPILWGELAGENSTGPHVTIVPSVPPEDPLISHIALVLQTALEAEDTATHLYAQTLAEAVVIHFLRRYATTRPAPQTESMGALLPYKLQRTLAYIQYHMDEKLSLERLAVIAQMSPTHFAHLFKLSTGLSPHRYVSRSRIERAKELLIDTEMSLIDIAHQVGCADQSHFTALFRAHTALTPRAYRNAPQQAV